jgi:DNA invertase Pin-like site-specific DNA recombinase
MRERILRQISTVREKHEAEIRRLVARAARVGVRSEDIARALGIGRSTLWRRYKDDLTRRQDEEERRRAAA